MNSQETYNGLNRSASCMRIVSAIAVIAWWAYVAFEVHSLSEFATCVMTMTTYGFITFVASFAFEAIRDIAISSQRTADTLERMTNRKRDTSS